MSNQTITINCKWPFQSAFLLDTFITLIMMSIDEHIWTWVGPDVLPIIHGQQTSVCRIATSVHVDWQRLLATTTVIPSNQGNWWFNRTLSIDRQRRQLVWTGTKSHRLRLSATRRSIAELRRARTVHDIISIAHHSRICELGYLVGRLETGAPEAERVLECHPELEWHELIEDRVDGGRQVVGHTRNVRHNRVDGHDGSVWLGDVGGQDALGVKRWPADEERGHHGNYGDNWKEDYL